MTTTMKAVRIHAYGGPEVLTYEDAPRPEPGEGEVLVRIHAAGVNPVDCKTRAGQGIGGGEVDRLPLILGWDISGVVVAVGPAASGFGAGDEVFGLVRFPEFGSAYAEYAAVPAADLIPKPAALDHVQAAAVPLAALTAWQALVEAAELEAGQTVLVHRAAGGVGHFAVQLAKARGARVIGTASARNAEFLRGLGVDQVIDYTASRFEDAAHDVDVVFDTVGGEVRERSWRVLRPGGILVSIVGPPSPPDAAAGIRAVGIMVRPEADQLAEIARLIEAGSIRPSVGTVLPLAQARAAHELSEGGRARGKIVLRLDA